MKQKGKEFEISFHLIYLCVLTILGLVMLWVETGAGRPIVIRILCLLVLILIWVAHCTQIGTASQRVYFYTITATLFLMYYGSHRASITDMPLVLCLILIVLSLQEDMGLIYLISISYPLMILHHIFITQYLSENMTKLVLSRLVLGVVCVGLSVFISHFFIRANENKRQELLKMQKEIESSRNQTKNLLANVSHELRTPITAINGMTEILLQRQLDESLMGQIDDIHQSGQRIQSQINGILDYAELNTGTMVLNEQVYNVRELVDRCAYALYANRDGKNLAVSVDVDSAIPTFLYGDGEKIVRAMHQLIDNAYKFTNYGSIRLRVFSRREDYGINLIFEVSDTGVGMSKELIHRLFEGAYKEDADSARLTSGLGIGFTIAHELTRAMNGFIYVKSRVGNGTDIRVTIPQKPAVIEAKKPIEPVKEEQTTAPGNTRILVIDDERLNLKVVRGMLETVGYQVKIAEGGSEGLALCELEDFDFIFLDYMMPGMDGEETLRRIRSVRNGFYQQVPIVALTANAASSARVQLLELGFDEFVEKPVEIERLKRVVEELTGGNKNE